MIIALGHRSRVGKDTAAKMLVSMLRTSNKYPRGVVKASFAKPLKDAAHLIWGYQGLKPGEWYEEHPEDRKVKLESGLDAVDYWIALGKAVRGIWGPSWRDAALALAKSCDALIVPDLRFINEGEGVHALGGLCIRIENPRITEWRDADHELKDWPDFDETIVNDGSLKDFHDKVYAMALRRNLI